MTTNNRLLLLLLALCLTFPAAHAADYRTSEYRQLQSRICSGWNTWYNNSMTSFVHLPEGFAINLCLASKHNDRLLKEVFKKSDFEDNPEHVYPGLRADDGSYTSMRICYAEIEVVIESATDGDDELILVTPANPTDNFVVVEPGILYGNNGTVGKEQSCLTASCGEKRFVVRTTTAPVNAEFLASSAPRLACALNHPIGIYTGAPRSLQEIQDKVNAARKSLEQQRAAKYGELLNSFTPMQTILAWNTIYDPLNRRAITPVSRNWNKDWGGYVLFDWDTYFAAYMLSFFNKDLAFSNAIAITKAITPDGFIPNFESNGRMSSSWDRSQPPVGSEIVWRIYQRHPEKWFLVEVYDELLRWNRWWTENRMSGGYLAWGSHCIRDGKDYTEGLLGAKLESGLDNSPMFDDASFNDSTFTMQLADVGLNSMYVMDCNALAEIATVLGKKQDAKELKARAKTFARKVEKLWDDESGIFLNLHTDTGIRSHRLSPTNFYPMLAGICTQQQAERMMNDYYFNPKYFHGEFVMPSIARNDPGFNDNEYWRGRIWAPLNFLVYIGMQKYDVSEARKDLVQRSKALLMKNWNENGGVFENYNAVTGQGDDVQRADGFYHWGALLTFLELLEKGL